MEKEEQEGVRTAVEEILAEVDIKDVSEKQVREMASKKTGLDLSASKESRKFVLNVIKKAMETSVGASDADADAEAEEEAKASPLKNRPKSSKRTKKSKEMDDFIDDEDVEDQDSEDDEEDAGGSRKRKFETDDEGNTVICELSAKRKVVVSQWRGKTLVSVREYYEKDGKVLPTAKGISLTTEQFQILAKSVKDIEGAISALKE